MSCEKVIRELHLKIKYTNINSPHAIEGSYILQGLSMNCRDGADRHTHTASILNPLSLAQKDQIWKDNMKKAKAYLGKPEKA